MIYWSSYLQTSIRYIPEIRTILLLTERKLFSLTENDLIQKSCLASHLNSDRISRKTMSGNLQSCFPTPWLRRVRSRLRRRKNIEQRQTAKQRFFFSPFFSRRGQAMRILSPKKQWESSRRRKGISWKPKRKNKPEMFSRTTTRRTRETFSPNPEEKEKRLHACAIS